MLKSELRKKYKDARAAIAEKDFLRGNDLLLINFQKIELPVLNVVHTYISSERHIEIETTPIIRFLEFRNPGLRVCVPKVSKNGVSMASVIVDDETLYELSTFGISQPIAGEKISPSLIDLVLVPLLAFDKSGYRVGFGKGFYDKFLHDCRSDVIKVGLTFFEAEERIDDIREHDIPLDFCVTPKKVYSF